MSILVDENTRIIVQGFGKAGSFHAEQCMKYGAQIVGGIRPGKGGTEQLGVPVFDTVQQAVKKVKPDASMIFVPAPGAAGWRGWATARASWTRCSPEPWAGSSQ